MRALVAILVMLQVFGAEAKTYECVEKKGHVTYKSFSDKPCPTPEPQRQPDSIILHEFRMQGEDPGTASDFSQVAPSESEYQKNMRRMQEYEARKQAEKRRQEQAELNRRARMNRDNQARSEAYRERVEAEETERRRKNCGSRLRRDAKHGQSAELTCDAQGYVRARPDARGYYYSYELDERVPDGYRYVPGRGECYLYKGNIQRCDR